MKSMKARSILVIFVFSALVFPSFAQGPPRGKGLQGRSLNRAEMAKKSRPQRGNPRLPVLSAILELTDAQQAAIKEIAASHRATLRGLHKALREAQGNVKAAIKEGSALNIGNAVLSSSKIRESIAAANKRHKTDFTNVLTAAQSERLQNFTKATRGAKMRKGNKPPRRQQPGRRPGGRTPPGK